MISYETIVQQIEKHAIQAKQTRDEQQIREQLSAIRALCNVVLDEGKPVAKPSVAAPHVHNIQTTSMMISQPLVTSSQKLEEEDANGESLFDF
ncbi:YwdI family protein [Solibacillus cecembensis]|uniref:YwdI family protein n=1 Tax=Solibacillus cecembensis TaxID=459347 RepID=UPI003AA51DE2